MSYEARHEGGPLSGHITTYSRKMGGFIGYGVAIEGCDDEVDYCRYIRTTDTEEYGVYTYEKRERISI